MSTPARDRLRLRDIAALVALSVGMFTLVTSEQLPIGVLAIQAADMGVSVGLAGLAVTVPGILGAVLALAAPVLIGSLDRRLAILIGLVAIVASTVISALATSFAVLLAARALTGVAIGLYWPILPVVALRQVPREHASTALTIVYAGNSGALVLGVPFVAWIGAALSWRASYAIVGGIALLVLVVAAVLVRPVRPGARVTGRAMLHAVRAAPVLWAATMTLLLVAGHYAAYSYVAPVLMRGAGVPAEGVSLYLLVFGVVGILGNFLVGPLLARRPSYVILALAVGISAVLLAMAAVVSSPASAWIALPLWGLFAGALSVSIQAYVSQAGAEAGVEEEATAVNAAIFTGSIAIGAAMGGVLYETGGQTALMLGALVLTLGAAITAALASRRSFDPGRTPGASR